MRKDGLLNFEDHNFLPTADAVSKITVRGNKRIYTFYRDYNLWEEDLLTMRQWNIVTSTIFKNIAEAVIDNTSGVYMDKWGYFGIMKYPQVPDSVYLLEDALKMYEGGVIYRPVFLPIRTDAALNSWTLNGKFSRKLLNKIYDKVYEHHKYKFTYTPLRAVYGVKRAR